MKMSKLSLSLILVSLADLSNAQVFESNAHKLELSARTRTAYLEREYEDGTAASVLLRINLHSEWTDTITSVLEIDHVETFFKDDHSDAVRINGKPVIPDPPGTEINQLLVDYRSDLFNLRAGRQRINFDNQRFIGSASFWQNEQTFDALSGNAQLLTSSSITYAYLANVNRIFGEHANNNLSESDVIYGAQAGKRPYLLLGDYELNAHLARIEINEWDYSRLVAYGYLIDNKDAPNLSNNTFGLKYHFSYKIGAIKYRADLETAIQELHDLANPMRIPYYLVDLGIAINKFEFVGRYEILASERNWGFITPLGSVHEYQGWADKFVNTPAAGVRDTSLRINWRFHPWRIDARYHFFAEDSGHSRYGEEFDLDIAFKPWRKHELLLRYADFRSAPAYGATFTDEKKLMLNYSYNF